MPNILTSLNNSLRILVAAGLTALVVAGCGGSGVSGGAGTTPTPTPPVVDPTTTVAKIVMSSSLGAVKSDNSDQSDVTATMLDAGNAIVVGATAAFTTNTGVLIVADAKSNAEGKVIGKFSSGSADPSSRTATIIVTSNGVSSQIPIRVTGSTIDLSLVGSASLPNDGSKTTDLVITVKNAAGIPVNGSPVSVSSVAAPTGSTPGGEITFITAASGNTDASGKFVTTVAGKTAGAVNALVSAVGETRAQAFTVTQTASTSAALSISAVNGAALPANRVVPLSIGGQMTVVVAASSPTSSITFASSLGAWDGGTSSVVTVPVSAGVASAVLVSPTAGLASVQIYDTAKPSSTESFTAAITAPSTAAAFITIQASPNVVPKSGGGVTGTSFLLAKVTDAGGNPVGGAAVSFEIVKSTGGGESISPVVQLTYDGSTLTPGLNLGEAKITFTSGSLPSAQGGVAIRAKVVAKPTVTTDDDPNTALSDDAKITIGGTAGSITFGQATEIGENSNKTAYILPMSVQVADSNGNPVAGAKISLSAWPYAWSTGAFCQVARTFLNEDTNENLILGAEEDGVRAELDNITFAKGATGVGTKDGKITAPNSAAGTLPSVVTTDASGLATFDYTYTKPNSIWIVTRIRASALVQGTETVAETKFRLSPTKPDVDPDCKIPDSPYVY